jgi:hypothetical protein
VADDGATVGQANWKGEEEIVYCDYRTMLCG